MALRPPSILRTIRAIGEAHLRTAINAGFRGAGKWLTLFASAVTVLVSLLALGPLVIGCGALGFLASTLANAGGVVMIGWFFTLTPIAAAFFSMLNGDARSLDWQKLKGYPVAPLALFCAEVLASCFHLLVAMALLSLSAFTVGLAIGSSKVASAALAPLVCALLTTLALRSLLASVAGWLVRRLQILFLLGAVVVPAPMMLLAFDEPSVRRGEQVVERIGRFAGWLPASLQLHAVQAESWGGFLARLGLPFVLPLALFALSYRLAFREVEPNARAKRAPEKLWSHGSRVLTLARLTVISIWSSDVGRMQMLTPVLFAFPLFVARFKLAAVIRPELGYFIVWTMTPTMLLNLSLNQFGSDRGAVKALLLMPLSPRELLQGKALGLAVIAAANAALLSVVGWVLLRPSPSALLEGALAGLALFLIGITVGQFTSIAWPRPLPMKGLRAPQGGVMLAFISLGLLFGVSVPVMLVSFWLQDSPVALVLVMALFAAAAFSLFFGSTQLAERYFQSRQERLVETLG